MSCLTLHDPQLVRLAGAIAEKVGPERFHVWFDNSTRIELRNESLEIAVPNEAAEGLLQRLVDAEITPAGLGARDTLRLEAALPLYGHELTLTSTTLEARLGWVLGWDKETFRGRSAVVRERDRCPDKLLTGLIVEGRQPLRDGG